MSCYLGCGDFYFIVMCGCLLNSIVVLSICFLFKDQSIDNRHKSIFPEK